MCTPLGRALEAERQRRRFQRGQSRPVGQAREDAPPPSPALQDAHPAQLPRLENADAPPRHHHCLCVHLALVQ
eukprot:6297916-Pyramimonas_sp.AAC.1